MKQRVIIFLVQHPFLLRILYLCLRCITDFVGFFVPRKNKILFVSFGGRKFDDSPYVLYKDMCKDSHFDTYKMVWVFREPENFSIPRGEKVKIDTPAFFYELLSSKIWISNSGMDRGIGLSRRGRISVETWHGSPFKRICGEEVRGSVLNENYLRKKDYKTIRCAQNKYDLEIFARVFNADKGAFLLSDLPRNDDLTKDIIPEEIKKIKEKLNIPLNKKIILYMPTYREYWLDRDANIVMKQTISVQKWKKCLSSNYILLVRAHYAVSKAMKLDSGGSKFCFDVSAYEPLNDLYKIADILVSDYSSAFIDFSILERPMFCFAHDYDEYKMQRGFYYDLHKILPCPVDLEEETVINRICNLRPGDYLEKVRKFRNEFAPYAGSASQKVIEEIICNMEKTKRGNSTA